VLAVTVRAQSAAQGVSATNPNINVMDIFTAHVLPELQQADIEDRPIVKADSIKFASTFRNQFPIETTRALMPLLVNHLVSQQVRQLSGLFAGRVCTVFGS
jgi:exportin-2 (importin alpha re-exporter)